MNMKQEDIEFLHSAVSFFERPTSFTRALSGLGSIVEGSFAKLPDSIKSRAMTASRKAIEKCLDVALRTISEDTRSNRSAHTIATGLTGAVSGFMGPLALAVELPISTALMMRSIAATAQEYGFDPKSPEIVTECLFVFAIGGPSKNDDGMDSSYLTSRLALSSLMRKATASLLEIPAKQLLLGLEKDAAPAVLRLVAVVSETFGVRVSQKFVAQLAPVVGAAGGAAINVAFSNFFGEAAKFHFGMKRLEMTYGAEIVQASYREELARLKK